MRTRVASFLLALAAASMAGHHGARAYELKPYRWTSTPVPFFVNPANRDVPEEDATWAIQRGAAVWSEQTRANVALVYQGPTDATAVQNDGVNAVFFRDDASGNTTAIAYTWFDGDNRLLAADIVFLDGGHQFVTDRQACSNAVHIEDTAAHEFGHALGLGHSADATATMYPVSVACSTEGRSLAPDDVAAIEAVYPPLAVPGAPGAFGKLSPGQAASGLTAPVTLAWQAASGATGYAYCVDTTDNGGCEASWVPVGTATSATVSGLAPWTTYSWQVRAENGSGLTYADANAWRRFTTKALPPDALPNDLCPSATIVDTTPFSDHVAIWKATTSPGDPVPPAGNGSRTQSVWYRLSLPTGGRVVVDTEGSDYQAILSAWTGGCGAPEAAPGVTYDTSDLPAAGRLSMRVAAGQSYWVMVSAASAVPVDGTLGLRVRYARGNGFDSDGATDSVVYRASSGEWWVRPSTGASPWSQVFGAAADRPIPGDYDGDGRTDIAVYRPSTGTWFVLTSGSGYTQYTARGWGIDAQGDAPVPGDYDGDGQTDLAVYRPAHGTWFVLRSSTNQTVHDVLGWGAPTDRPVPADYDGDGRTDVAVYRPASGQWFLLYAAQQFATSAVVPFGAPGDQPIPADYDGDGRTDIAVYRPATGTWFWLESSTGNARYEFKGWGVAAHGDVPVPGDYDGDGRTDPCVYRPAHGTWFVLRSSSGYSEYSAYGWGLGSDQPIGGIP